MKKILRISLILLLVLSLLVVCVLPAFAAADGNGKIDRQIYTLAQRGMPEIPITIHLYSALDADEMIGRVNRDAVSKALEEKTGKEALLADWHAAEAAVRALLSDNAATIIENYLSARNIDREKIWYCGVLKPYIYMTATLAEIETIAQDEEVVCISCNMQADTIAVPAVEGLTRCESFITVKDAVAEISAYIATTDAQYSIKVELQQKADAKYRTVSRQSVEYGVDVPADDNGSTSHDETPNVWQFAVSSDGDYRARTVFAAAGQTVVVYSYPNQDSHQGDDVNGDGRINSTDARITLRAAARLDTLSESERLAADTDGDGAVTAADARNILRMAARLG